ncbi:MAG: glutamate 5-kinase [Verrucomicrobiales bacterium]|jgi:glutamate 5-kinase|nr:glutamate 5-kinase [Verrucomicrobiales bacterium]
MAESKTGKRVVIKIGTGVLTRRAGGEIHHAMLARLSQAIADLRAAGNEVVVVSSGAVGAGLSTFGLTQRPIETDMLQACAAAGQARLMHLYETQFSHHGLKVAQLLVTHDDLNDERRSANVLATVNAILPHTTVIPIVNENDSVSVYELKVGDNDVLSSILARLIGADLLVLLTSVRGLMGPDATSEEDIINRVDDIETVLDFARDEKGELSVGGMTSKLRAVKEAVSAGVETVIASGLHPEQIGDIVDGHGIGTRFPVPS